MTYPAAVPVQHIARTIAPAGSSYTGTKYVEAAPVATTAVFAPGGSTETVQGGDTVITQPTLYGVDETLAVTALDVFVIGGDRYEVDGDPQAGFQSPFSGWRPGVVVQLRKVSG